MPIDVLHHATGKSLGSSNVTLTSTALKHVVKDGDGVVHLEVTSTSVKSFDVNGNLLDSKSGLSLPATVTVKRLGGNPVAVSLS